MPQRKLLLTSVVGPYGIEDEYAAGYGMLMDGLKINLCYGQGVHAPQATQSSFALDLLALNISVPTTVLDFPSWQRFTRELEKGYTDVGISFVMANVYKAKRMAEYIRAHYPDVKIILGSYGTLIPGIEDMLPFDAMCRGEGVRWLRAYFGDDPNAPLVHPVMSYLTKMRAYGVNVSKRLKSAIIIPGLGCEGACDFCSTTRMFDYHYLPMLRNGQEFFELCLRGDAQLGIQSFAVYDENFAKNTQMAREILAEMERHGKPYKFTMFASANVVQAMGADFLVRMGFEQILIGVESTQRPYAKTQGVDMAALVRDLQDKGITVTTSIILFLEEHNKQNIWDEINAAIALGSEIQIFNMVVPIPGTQLYDEFRNKGYVDEQPNYREMHALTLVVPRHPHFTTDEAHDIQVKAYRMKYEANGPVTLAKCHTMVRGYLRAMEDFKTREREGLAWDEEAMRYVKRDNPAPDTFMKLRIAELRDRARRGRPILLTCWAYAVNQNARRKARETMHLYRKAFGPMTPIEWIVSLGVLCTASIEAIRIWIREKLLGKHPSGYQPPTRCVQYPGAALRHDAQHGH